MASYFLVQNMGYDGLYIDLFTDLSIAEEAFAVFLAKQKAWDKRYPHYPSDKGLALIEGSVILSDSLEDLSLGKE